MVCCSERTHTNHVLCSNFDGKNIHRNADIRSGPLRALALSAKAPAQKGTSLLMLRCCNLSTFPRISKTTAYTQTTHTYTLFVMFLVFMLPYAGRHVVRCATTHRPGRQRDDILCESLSLYGWWHAVCAPLRFYCLPVHCGTACECVYVSMFRRIPGKLQCQKRTRVPRSQRAASERNARTTPLQTRYFIRAIL